MRSDRYQINAKAEGEQHQEMLRGPMLRALLEDRFKLKIRRETREVPVYELKVGKNLKLEPHKEGSCVPLDFEHPPALPTPGNFTLICGMIHGTREFMETAGVTMSEFANQLGAFLDREVIDKTGIDGSFDVRIDGAIQDLFPRVRMNGNDSPPPADDAGPTIFEALKQVGLKLDSGKGPGRFLVIDHVEKPTPN